jgi:hypothetical protein
MRWTASHCAIVGVSVRQVRANASLSDMIMQKNAEHPVIVYSKTYCPYCHQAKELFASLGVQAKAIELDTLGALSACFLTMCGRSIVFFSNMCLSTHREDDFYGTGSFSRSLRACSTGILGVSFTRYEMFWKWVAFRAALLLSNGNHSVTVKEPGVIY